MESEVFNYLTIYLEHSVLATGGLSYLTVLARIMPTLKSWPVPKFISERQSLSLLYYVESHFNNLMPFPPFLRHKSVLLFLWLPPVLSFLMMLSLPPCSESIHSAFILPFLSLSWFFLFWNAFFSWYNNSLSTHQLCYYDHNGLSL